MSSRPRALLVLLLAGLATAPAAEIVKKTAVIGSADDGPGGHRRNGGGGLRDASGSGRPTALPARQPAFS
jgi:hypothetical protein